MVRPERIRVYGVGEAPPPGNSARGRIRQEIYLGSARKLEVDLADGSHVLVRESAGAISDRRPGDEVWLTFRIEDAAVLRAHDHDNAHDGSDPSPALLDN